VCRLEEELDKDAILFNLYSECLTKEALDVLGDFNIGGRIIQTVKYADDLVLMAKEEILHEIRKRKAKWIGHNLRRNYLIKQVIEGKMKGEIDVTRIRGRRRKKLLDDPKDRRGYSHLNGEVLDRTMWRNHFERGVGPVVLQITE